MSSSYSEIVITRVRQGQGCLLGRLSIHRPFGGVSIPFLAHTLELPWQNNENRKSCIPPGRYPAVIRTDGKRGWRIQLKDVSKRTYIQIHAGNTAADIDGCILPGLRIEGDHAVTSSRLAMKLLRDEITKSSKDPQIMVIVEDPGVIKSYSTPVGE